MGCSVSAAKVQNAEQNQGPGNAGGQNRTLTMELLPPIRVLPTESQTTYVKVKPFHGESKIFSDLPKTKSTSGFEGKSLRSEHYESEVEIQDPLNLTNRRPRRVIETIALHDFGSICENPRETAHEQALVKSPLAALLVPELNRIAECDSRQEFSQMQEEQIRKTIGTHCKVSQNSQELYSSVSKRASIHRNLRFASTEEKDKQVVSDCQMQKVCKKGTGSQDLKGYPPFKSETLITPSRGASPPYINDFPKEISKHQIKSSILPQSEEGILIPHGAKLITRERRSHSCFSLKTDHYT